MTVLVCDDDPATRHVLKRLLVRTFNAEVDEVENGLEALDRLSKQRYDVVMLDIHMPILDGVETLEALRSADEYKELPVMILTGEKDENVIKQLIALGVSDFILKPPNVERVTARFERLQNILGQDGRRQSDTASDAPPLREGDAVVLVEGDAEYRKVFTEAVGPLFRLTVCETGTAALDTCVKQTPSALFIGKGIGLVSAERLAKKLRQSAACRCRLIGLAARSELEAARQAGWYDDVVVRSFVAGTLKSDVERLMRPQSTLGQFQTIAPGLRSALIAAAEQMFGMMLSSEVETSDEPLAVGDQPVALANVTMSVQGFALAFRFRYAFEDGRNIAAAFLEAQAEEMTDEDVESVAGELSNVMTGRLHNGYVKAGLQSRQGLPQLGTMPAGTPDDAVDTEDTVRLTFRAVGRPIAFETRVHVATDGASGDAAVEKVGGLTVVRSQAS